MARANIIPLFSNCDRPAALTNRANQDLGETLFRAMDLGTADSIVFADEKLKILRVGDQTEDVHNAEAVGLIGKDVRCLFAPAGGTAVATAIQSLAGHESWAGEIDARRLPDDVFAADVTIKRIPLGGRPLYCLVIRDLSETKRLRELLRQQRSQRREMYVTLRNLMKAFEKEKKGLERGIYHKLKSLFLPSLEKIEAEPSAAIRNSYVNILRTQLIDMTQGFARELEGRFLTLTRSEMQICRLIQKGLATKEVADRINISFETVQTHRRNIRRKLCLTGRKVSLHAYLADKVVFWEADADTD